ncbi:MAG TPA: AarF/ABC1/UbiB kinase family protein [Candidatus Binataceae bacterium]|nr:AarF/ABC1/UbiB kinase family protein [Candidatus Binataceae bacterium]
MPSKRKNRKEPEPLSSIVTSRFIRSAKATVSGAGFAAGLVGDIAQGWLGGESSGENRAAERLAASLGSLKGLMMKVGQMVSYIDTALPPEVRAAMAALQDSSTPMAPEVVERVIREELGAPSKKIFAAFEPVPFAAASIGQVHRARLHEGAEVAVKVQYPEIAAAFKADLSNLAVMQSLSGILFRGMDTRGATAELEQRFMEECDYRAEARNQTEFISLYGGRDRIVVPEVYPAFSAGRVITTQFIAGRRFADFVANATESARNQAGELIYRVAFESIFKHALLNCDPHPGNYLFMDDGRIAFIDFGCVKRFKPAMIDQWRRLIQAALEGDRAGFDSLSMRMGFVGVREGFDFDYQWKMFHYFYRPLIEDRPFRFTDEYVAESFRLLYSNNPNKYKQNIPADMMFVNRLQWGLNSVLAGLNAEFNARRAMLPLLYIDGETPPST